MVESVASKIDRTQSEIEKIIELYDYAEQLYPYDRTRGPRKVSLTDSLSIID